VLNCKVGPDLQTLWHPRAAKSAAGCTGWIHAASELAEPVAKEHVAARCAVHPPTPSFLGSAHTERLKGLTSVFRRDGHDATQLADAQLSDLGVPGLAELPQLPDYSREARIREFDQLPLGCVEVSQLAVDLGAHDHVVVVGLVQQR